MRRMRMEVTQPTPNINDDCWSHIFSFLPVTDVIRIERVCKQWQAISLMTRKKIKITQSESTFFEQILQKQGNSIINLNVRCCDVNIFELLQKYCSKLLYLTLLVQTPLLVNDMEVKKFPFLKNLKSLDIETNGAISDSDFWKKLMDYLENADSLIGFCIVDKQKCVKICPELKRLYLSGMRLNAFISIVDWDRLLRLFLKVVDHKKGEILEFSVYYVEEFYLRNIEPISNELTTLALSKILGNCFEDNCIEDMEFQNLKKLSFSDLIWITDNELWTFINKCPQLEDITFSSGLKGDYCSEVSNFGYRRLAHLKNLKFLHIDSPFITCHTLEIIAANCTKLEKICCPNLIGLVPIKLFNIVDLLPNLCFMSLKDFKKLVKECLRFISESVRSRQNNVKLQIVFGELVNTDVVNRFLLKDKNLYPDLANDYLTISLKLDTFKDVNYYVDYDCNNIYLVKPFCKV